jgi:hypothetical protein
MKMIFFITIAITMLFSFGCIEDNQVIGGDTDDHGCLIGAGYSWCPSTQKCQKM